MPKIESSLTCELIVYGHRVAIDNSNECGADRPSHHRCTGMIPFKLHRTLMKYTAQMCTMGPYDGSIWDKQLLCSKTAPDGNVDTTLSFMTHGGGALLKDKGAQGCSNGRNTYRVGPVNWDDV